MWLVDPYAVPDDFLAPLFDGVSGVSPGAIGAGATGDVVLAPVYRADRVVAKPTVAVVLAAAEVQRVRAAPTADAVGATVAVDGVALRGAYEVLGPSSPLINAARAAPANTRTITLISVM